MTIMEAISRTDALKPNGFDQAEKIRWLSDLDGMVKKSIIDTHEGGEAITFEGYTEETPTDTILLITAPFEEVYLKWLEAQIDYHNGEYKRYNNSVLAYNAVYHEFTKHYNAHHMPISRVSRFLF